MIDAPERTPDGAAGPGLVARIDAMFGPGASTLRSATPARIEEEAVKLGWLIRLRWVAVVGQLAVIAPALYLGWLAREHLPAYLGTVAGLVVFNLVTARKLRLRSGEPSQNETLGQLLVDLVALMILLLLSGGAWNPLAPLVFIHAAMGALLLKGIRTLVLVGSLMALSTVISLTPFLPPALPIPPTPSGVVVPSFTLVAVLIWGMTASLGQNLTEHRRILLNLKDQQSRADRLRAAGALAAGFSHELATPINTIRLRLGRLGRRLAEDDGDLEAARLAVEQCEKVLRSLVGRQLDPSKMRLAEVGIVGMVRRACGSWSVGGRRAEVHDLVHGPLRAKMPPLAFTQALLNLLDNAAEASESARSTAPVDVEVSLHDRGFSVAVLDRGVGWPSMVRKNIGQPFLTTKDDGNGLGLYNAHTLAVALGGRLHLEDRDGGGAVARFVLPIGDPAENP